MAPFIKSRRIQCECLSYDSEMDTRDGSLRFNSYGIIPGFSVFIIFSSIIIKQMTSIAEHMPHPLSSSAPPACHLHPSVTVANLTMSSTT